MYYMLLSEIIFWKVFSSNEEVLHVLHVAERNYSVEGFLQ